MAANLLGALKSSGRSIIPQQAGAADRKIANNLLLRALQEQVQGRTPTAAWLKGGNRALKGLMGMYLQKKANEASAAQQEKLSKAMGAFYGPQKMIAGEPAPINVDPRFGPEEDWTSEDVRQTSIPDPNDTDQTRLRDLAMANPRLGTALAFEQLKNKAGGGGTSRQERQAKLYANMMGLDYTSADGYRAANEWAAAPLAAKNDQRSLQRSIYKTMLEGGYATAEEALKRTNEHLKALGYPLMGKKDVAPASDVTPETPKPDQGLAGALKRKITDAFSSEGDRGPRQRAPFDFSAAPGDMPYGPAARQQTPPLSRDYRIPSQSDVDMLTEAIGPDPANPLDPSAMLEFEQEFGPGSFQIWYGKKAGGPGNIIPLQPPNRLPPRF